ncbi:transcription factor HES-4-B-like [Culicoides brevitarsis]|uniref:transcription factor HES-4-B-like n=1 Tax=Culicoides brevitarsis TaxID=469753 RepID=UPI00307B2D7B
MDMPERFQLNDRVNGCDSRHLEIKSEENHMTESPAGTSQHGKQLGVSAKSKAEIRKSNKPIMEKKRRARINNCLEQLKKILLENVNKDSAQHSKLEKADILEMTVKHLQQIQRRQLIMAVSMERSVTEKFRTGFSECASEIKSFISQMPDLDPAVRQRLSNHLDASVAKVQTSTPSSLESKNGNHQWNQGNFNQIHANEPPFLDDLNNNQRLQMDLVPTRLPTGEIAFVMPNSSHLNVPNNASGMRFMSSNTSTPRLSAFNIVTSNKAHSIAKLQHTSPPLSPISTDDRQLRTPPSSTLSLLHSAFSQSFAGGNPFSSLSGSGRMDSGYKSDTSMSELICKPTVPQQSYMDLLKPKMPMGVALGPHSAESTLNLSCRDSPCSSGSSGLRMEMDNDKDPMWRPW